MKQPRKGTKSWYAKEMKKVFEQHRELTEYMETLNKQGKVKYGFIMAYGLHDSYAYQWLYGLGVSKNSPTSLRTCKLYGWGKAHTKVVSFKVVYEMAVNTYENAKKKVSEVEGVTC